MGKKKRNERELNHSKKNNYLVIKKKMKCLNLK